MENTDLAREVSHAERAAQGLDALAADGEPEAQADSLLAALRE